MVSSILAWGSPTIHPLRLETSSAFPFKGPLSIYAKGGRTYWSSSQGASGELGPPITTGGSRNTGLTPLVAAGRDLGLGRH